MYLSTAVLGKGKITHVQDGGQNWQYVEALLVWESHGGHGCLHALPVTRVIDGFVVQHTRLVEIKVVRGLGLQLQLGFIDKYVYVKVSNREFLREGEEERIKVENKRGSAKKIK